MTNNKEIKIEITLVVIALLTLNFISAFGVGFPYHEENRLELSAGESQEVKFNLQNIAGDEDISFKANIEEGSEIIKLSSPDEIYTIPVGSEVNVNANIIAPIDAKNGDIYPIKMTFNTVKQSESGAFGIGSSIGRNFEVLIVPTAEEKAKIEEREKAKPLIYIIAIVFAALVIIAAVMIKRKKQNNSSVKSTKIKQK